MIGNHIIKNFLCILMVFDIVSNVKIKQDNPRIIDAFILAYDAMYTYDIIHYKNGYTKDYIILDMESADFSETTYDDRQKMINHFKRYNKKILNASIFKLKEIGLADEMTQIAINGDILMFTCVRPDENSNGIIISGMKYHGPISAYIYEMKLDVIDNEWKLIEIKEKGVA
ncbi:hypothetical protein A500_08291 [Clostridium sartagoforme AAU1]|uniref:Uncharacterized protein n=2 Tax=Clostridium sartagoforme TaxID=84031 RepID=R9CAJ0_9CLOT|nr:hypothetical protein A500_08291 [Clostridium sartagoforme AAU1]